MSARSAADLDYLRRPSALQDVIGADQPTSTRTFYRGKRRKTSATLPRKALITAAAGLMVGTSAGVGTASAAPAAPVGLPNQVDALAAYKGASTCSASVKPGTKAFMKLLLDSYPNSRSAGIVRDCNIGGRSEHKEGRALDWGQRAWVASEAANVKSFMKWVLATDSQGNKHAMARRMGIMYMIWDDKIWTASKASAGWQPYLHRNCSSAAKCSSSLRHRDHVHISLSWDGAMGRTSFWSGKAGTERVAASRATTRAPLTSTTMTVSKAKSKVLRKGSRGSEVTVLQKALRMSHVTGYYGSITTKAVRHYQSKRGLVVDGVVGRRTWASLHNELARDSRRVATVKKKVVRVGAKGQAVRVLEAAMNLRVDGHYSWADRAAVKRFQTQRGIPSTGVVAKLTWGALRTA